MSPHDRIIVDPDILVGKPVVKGTRLSVDFLLGLLAQGWPEAEILRNYPGLQREDLLACWAYASEVLREEKVYRYQVAGGTIMQFLANENFPLDVVEALRHEGHDVAWIRTDAPGSKDPDILRRAVTENRVLLTFDKDFGDLAFQFGLPASCGIVLFRLQASSSAALAIMVVAAIRSRSDWAGNFSVVDPGRIRIRSLPTPPTP